MAIDPKILRKLNLYRQNPDIVQPLSNAELADLVVLVLSQVEVIDASIKDKKLDLDTKIGKNADDLVATTKKEVEALRKEATEQIRAQITEGAKTLANTSTELEKRVAAAIENIRDGENGIITDAEIGRAAQIASELIDLPDFEKVVQTEVQANGEQIRNALELLAGDERYKVEINDVEGLEDRLEQLKNIKSQGGGVGTSKPAVIRFVNEAIADGIIVVSSLPDQTGNSGKFLTTDGTDASWATLAGGGDMAQAVYDPRAIGGDAFDTDNHTDGTTNKVYTATEKTKLAGIEASATADQTGAEIKTAYEAEANTNAYTDAEKTLVGTALQPADISDAAYGVGWNGDTGAASKNAIYDKIESLPALSDGDKGDITVSGSGATWTIDDESVTLAKMAHVATNRILGRDTAGTGDVEALTANQAADTIGVGTADSPQFAGVNVGHATDTTITRVSAGVIAVEGTNVQLEPSEGGFADGDKTKLDGIEASADVTATANVTAAGALMDSEVTNLAQVKAFDTTDYATAAQGTTADSALQNVSEDTTPQLGGELDAQANSIGFTMQTATGDGTTTVDWGNGNHMDFTFGAFNETFTFTAPTKPGVYTMSLKQDSVGSRTATWPATVKWPAGTAPTLTTTATTGYDVVSFRYDGTNYYGIATLDFS